MKESLTLQEFYRREERKKGSFKKYGVFILFVLPFLLAFLVFFVYPLFYGIYISFTQYNLSYPGQETFVGLRWYQVLFNPHYKINGKVPMLKYYDSFWRAFFHTVIFAIIMVPIAIIVPLALAILINYKPPGFKLFRCLVYLPSIVPLSCAGAIFVMLFNPKDTAGVLATLFPNTIFDNVKWFTQTWFSFSINGSVYNVAYAWIPIFCMCFWGGWGGNFIILSAGLENVPRSLYEASSVDGCSRRHKIIYVTIPNIKGQLVLCLFTTIIGYMGLYGQNYVLLGGGPFTATTLNGAPAWGDTSTLLYYIQAIVDGSNAQLQSSFYGLASAASIVYALFVGIFTGIQQYATRDRKSGFKISEGYSKWKRIAQSKTANN